VAVSVGLIAALVVRGAQLLRRATGTRGAASEPVPVSGPARRPELVAGGRGGPTAIR